MMRSSTCSLPCSRVSPCHMPSGFTSVLSGAALSLHHPRLPPRQTWTHVPCLRARERAKPHWGTLAFDHVSRIPHSVSQPVFKPMSRVLARRLASSAHTLQPCGRRARQASIARRSISHTQLRILAPPTLWRRDRFHPPLRRDARNQREMGEEKVVPHLYRWSEPSGSVMVSWRE